VKTLKKDSLNILIIAAEASSATYATSLLKHWKDTGLSVKAYGIGNREMESLGFEIVGRSEDLAVMGLQEIISHWSVIKNAFHSLVAKAEKEKPDLVLLLDYPEFNLRFAKQMKKRHIPVVYYISPQIWAWRTYRVHKIKKIVDLMLVIFPFEKEFYSKYQVPVEFVGHPLVDLLEELSPPASVLEKEREILLKGPDKKILGLMPGSRKSEIKHNLKIQIETALLVQKKNPNIEPVIFIAPPLDESFMREEAEKFGFHGSMIKKDPFMMISLSDLILCASGTATLMVGLCQKPMVIMYRMNNFTAFMAKRLVKHVPFFGMVNLILGEEAVPERFQNEANPEVLSQLLLDIESNKNGQLDRIKQNLQALKEKLGAGGGIALLAKAIGKFKESS
jgi:lipid-A-disaccharide synthase